MNNISVEKRYNFIRGFFSRLGYNIDIRKMTGESFPEHVPEDFVSALKSVRERTLVPWEGLFLNWQAAEYISSNNIEGDVVECGVWRGGSAILLAKKFEKHNALKGRKFWLYDTFAGMPKPSEEDVSRIGPAMQDWLSRQQGDKTDGSLWCAADLEDAQRGFKEHFSNITPFVFIKGLVEETIQKQKPEKIAILRLDTDFYESTLCELRELYPRLVKGGILILDDYHFWQGAKKATDEYFASLTEKPLFITESHSGRVMIVK